MPRDFSITGVAARHWAEDFRPPLTAADVPAHDMGAHAVELLLERIADPTSAPGTCCSHRRSRCAPRPARPPARIPLTNALNGSSPNRFVVAG